MLTFITAAALGALTRTKVSDEEISMYPQQTIAYFTQDGILKE